MTYDFWAIEGEVISELANFEEEVLVIPEGWEEEKEILKIWKFVSPCRELNPGHLGECLTAGVTLCRSKTWIGMKVQKIVSNFPN